MHDGNAFAKLWALGYQRLVPITPPNCTVSERSSLFRRIKHGDDARGKAPGMRWSGGSWSGMDWIRLTCTEADLAKWHSWGAGVGIRTGDGLALIDADTLHEDRAKIILEAVQKHFGTLPVRIGRYPKAGYLIRVRGDFKYTRIDFRDESDAKAERVEILYDGRQFVAQGIHPATGKPYTWPHGLPAYSDVPEFDADALTAFLEALKPLLPNATDPKSEGGADAPDQETLKGDPALIEKAVRLTPNNSADFPGRNEYIAYGYAVKGALQDDPALAYELWADWCARWSDPAYPDGNDPGLIAEDWGRMQPPFRVGASLVYETAERLAPKEFDRAEQWFQEIPVSDGDALFPMEPSPAEQARARIRATPYEFPSVSSIPVRAFLYGSHYTRQFVSATVAPSGVGKSSLTLVEALAMASGKALLGVEPKQCCRVWLWNGEDPRNELDRRINAAMQHYGLTPDDFGGRLFVDSGRDIEIVMATQTRDGARIAAPVSAAVLSELSARAIDALIIDPFVSSHRVSENDNDAIDMVTKEWARIADRANCCIELVHHVRKLNGAEISVEDSRGAVALIATSRSARALAKMTKAEAGRLGLEHVRPFLFRFADGKANMAPPIATDDTAWMELRNVALGNGEGSGVDALLTGDNVQVVCAYRVEGLAAIATGDTAAALATIASSEWRRDVRAGDAWVGAAIAQAMHFDLDDGDDKARVKQIISEWLKNGLLKEVTRNDEKRKPRAYVIRGEADTTSESVFE
jgi:hypothetical protein